MRAAFAQRLVVAILCGLLGCQNGPGFMALNRSQGNAPAVVTASTLGPPPATQLASATPVQRVNYVEEVPVKTGSVGDAAATQDVTLSEPLADAKDGPVTEFMHSLVPGSEPTFYLESAIMRGQTPLRDFFVSDRFLVASIVVAAIVIPFAVHDSRQPLPPQQGTQ
jgi:hypothetical protein